MARTFTIIAYILITMNIVAFSARAASASPHARHAIKPAPRVTVLAEGKVLHGDPRAFTGLATVDRKAVFESIPAYQQIKREGLNRRDPRYHFLLNEANRAFNRTLERASKYFRVDLIVQEGNVRAVGIEIVDLTPAMRKAVSKKRGATSKN